MFETVLRLLRKGRPEAEGLEIFSSLLFASTLEHNLTSLDNDRLARFAQAAFAFIVRKPHKSHAVNVRRTDLLSGATGASPSAVVIEILNDDMPYVVESVMAEINARGFSPLLVFHPIFKVQRFGSGRLTAVVGPGDRNWAAGDQESYVAVVIEGGEEQALRELAEALSAVLVDVRHACIDADAMRARLQLAINAYETMPLAISGAAGSSLGAEFNEAIEFLKWLLKGNFTPLGLRDYEFIGTDKAADLWPSQTGALGVLRSPELMVLRRGTEQVQITPQIRAFYGSPSPLIITKASALSRVRNRRHLDYIGIKRYGGGGGTLVGELRLVGLFTPTAYLQAVEAVPLVRQKVRKVLALAQFPPDSHSGRTLVDILETFPRDELFQIDLGHLQAWSLVLLDLQLRPRIRVLARRDEFGRYASVLVFVPRDQYSSQNRERIGAYLAETFAGRVAAFYPSITAAPLVRTQFIIALAGETTREVSDAQLESAIGEILRTWGDKLEQATAARSAALTPVYRRAFSAGYMETFDVSRAIEDIERIERLGPERPVAIDFYREPGSAAGRVRAAVYRYDMPIPLSERVPLLENLGFRVIDERSYHVRPELPGGARTIVLHDMVLETIGGAAIDLSSLDVRMENCFLAVFHGEAENDNFNGLVLAAGLEWREAAVLRAYASYLRQIRAPFGPRYIAETMIRHPSIARDLFELFRARFDPDQLHTAAARTKATEELRQALELQLAGVESLEEDRILRRVLGLILATVRTNFFATASGEPLPETIAFKLDCSLVDALPEPRPFREIWVTSPRVEGVHLRFAAIARGGIRWSDRPQDFRTEVLGLAKAQQVKNTVIVPSGAKGGFVPRRQPREATREAVQQEGVASYRIFISALLALTDNILDGRTVRPARVICHDGDDPYLVVAADKGTATFSDYANEISLARGFWLGDAFASGGSAGYDHKKLGITARGAWELVKRHFREMDVDIQRQPFTVVGVGDMSGDVFGNAMLLSPQTRLVAAFDHRDIFIDPAPDPLVSLAERKRLFDLPRSSWQSYDLAKISTGGGVFPRAAKSIELSEQMRALTGLTGAATTPNELIQALLRAPVDLLWFGGIGTFVRAASETDDQAGDRANDAVRITGEEVRAKVIGEGANLGVTQRGRIEAAGHGVRLNADFIDNSAGVNTSDQEVNIKIALQPAILAGRLDKDARNRLLAGMSQDVAAAVLSNNIQQGLALSLAERTSRRDIALLGRLARSLEERRLLVRRLEALPTGAEFTARAEAGSGMTRPELAVLLSWAKIALNTELLASDVPDDPQFAPLLPEYFPPVMRESNAADIAAHRLRREIIATRITNSMINRGGPALVTRLAEETGCSVPDIARAFAAARTIFGLQQIWSGLDALDGKIGGQLQLGLYQAVQDLLLEQTALLLRQQGKRTQAELIAAYRPAAELLMTEAHGIAAGRMRAGLAAESERLVAAGVPADLARVLSGLPVWKQVVDLADCSHRYGGTVDATARVLFAAGEYLRSGEISAQAAALRPMDDFDRQAIDAALAEIAAADRSLTERLLRDQADAGSDVPAWIAANAPRLAEAKQIVDTILAQSELTISRLTVAAAKVRGALGG